VGARLPPVQGPFRQLSGILLWQPDVSGWCDGRLSVCGRCGRVTKRRPSHPMTVCVCLCVCVCACRRRRRRILLWVRDRTGVLPSLPVRFCEYTMGRIRYGADRTGRGTRAFLSRLVRSLSHSFVRSFPYPPPLHHLSIHRQFGNVAVCRSDPFHRVSLGRLLRPTGNTDVGRIGSARTDPVLHQ
jgi:hypothetical protein